jgi:hypothetical protein
MPILNVGHISTREQVAFDGHRRRRSKTKQKNRNFQDSKIKIWNIKKTSSRDVIRFGESNMTSVMIMSDGKKKKRYFTWR